MYVHILLLVPLYLASWGLHLTAGTPIKRLYFIFLRTHLWLLNDAIVGSCITHFLHCSGQSRKRLLTGGSIPGFALATYQE